MTIIPVYSLASLVRTGPGGRRAVNDLPSPKRIVTSTARMSNILNKTDF